MSADGLSRWHEDDDDDYDDDYDDEFVSKHNATGM